MLAELEGHSLGGLLVVLFRLFDDADVVVVGGHDVLFQVIFQIS